MATAIPSIIRVFWDINNKKAYGGKVMKKKIYLALLVAMTISVAGCGKKTGETTADTTPEPTQEATVTEESTPEPEENTQDAPAAETASGDDTGVYPSATGTTEVNMGITEDVCTVKVPLNYVLAGVYYDENMQKQSMEGLSSATTTVEEALAAGSFSTGVHMAEFSMTSLEADETMISAKMYPADRTPWEKFKEHFTDAKEIGNDSVPGLIYHTQTGSGTNLAVAVKVNDSNTLELIYTGSLEDEIGADELGQRLYDLVTVK